jgi:hypothetical protein
LGTALAAAAIAGGLGVGAGVIGPSRASEPASSTVAVPPAQGGTATASWTGTIPASAPNLLGQCSDDVFADAHAVAFSVPAGLYDTKSATFTFELTWTPSNPNGDATTSDEVITVRDSAGTVVANHDGSETTETAVALDLPAGDYKVLACGFVNSTAQPYKGTVTVTTGPKRAATPAAPTNPNTANDNLLTFTEATVVDPILFGGEPGINFDPTTDGSRLFVDWPVSSRTNIGVLFRSDDGGLSFRKRYADQSDPDNAGLTCAGRQVPMCTAGGGGDTDVHINPGNGNVYFSSQEALAAQAVATSFDHGVTFPTDHTDPVTSVPCTGVDRQWLASWANTDDVFLAFHVPIAGECFSHSTQSGKMATWDHSVAFANVTQSGSMVADNTGGPHNKNLYVTYLPSLLGGLDDVATFGIAVSTDGGATWAERRIPGAKNLRNFNKVQLDSAGNLYATWVDNQTQHTWLSTSLASDPANAAAPASKWSTPVIVEGGPVRVTIFPDVVAGSPGKAAVAFYGTAANADSPDAVLAGQGGWHPYVATSYNALCQWEAVPCQSPTFHQSAIAHQANHDDNICTSGTACVAMPSPAKPGNRNLLDYFDISLDQNGYVGFVWSDTRNATGLPFVKVATQAGGPSLVDGRPPALLGKRVNGAADPAGDALYPIAGKKVLTAANHEGQDLLGTTLEFKDPQTIEVRMRVADPSKLGGFPTGTDDLTQLQQAKYLTRWDFKGDAWYVGAAVAAGSSTPSFFAGKVGPDEQLLALGSTSNFGNSYKPLVTTGVTGKVEAGAIVIDVPISAVGSPTLNSPLYSVGSYALLGPDDATAFVNTAPITVDATPTFDTALSGPAAADILAGRNGSGAGGSGAGSGPLPATGGSGTAWTLAGLGALVLAVLGLWTRRARRPA